MPWADVGSRFTRDFEDQAAYFAQVMDRTAASRLLRIAWRTVGQIIERVVARLGPTDRLEGLEYIGIDELSYRRHHEYITCVVDHVESKVVWAAEGKSAATVDGFFKALGPERAARLKGVTIDMSGAYIDAVQRGAPQAQIIFDRFHVQRLAQDAVDQVRRDQVRMLAGSDEAATLKRTRWALLKNPWNLSAVESDKLADVQRANRPLYRAYLLKETLAEIFSRRQVGVAREKFTSWCRWAARSRLAPFKKLAGTIRRHLDGILASLRPALSTRTNRRPQRQDPNDHSTRLRLPQRRQPHQLHLPLLHRPHPSTRLQVAVIGTHSNVRRALFKEDSLRPVEFEHQRSWSLSHCDQPRPPAR